MKKEIIKRELSRREMLDITRKYGAKAALFATFSMSTMGFVPPLAQFVVNDAKAAGKAKYNLRYGASVISKGNEPRFQTKAYRFVVRRHINWNNQRPDLKEDLAHLVQDIKRHICGIASAGLPSFSV